MKMMAKAEKTGYLSAMLGRIGMERVRDAGAGPPILIQHLKIGGPARYALVSKLLAVGREGEA
jgi:hypothetical protein